VINVACGMLRLQFQTYIIKSLIAFISMSFISTTIGKSLKSIVLNTEPFRMMAFLKPELLILIAVLLLLIRAGAFL
jgi:uncharacterized membrane protein YdjX (TVP38/TMEM64 family)